MSQNGRLPSSQLAAIPGGRLRRDAAAAWNAMCAEAERRGLAVPHPTSSRTAYRSYAQQEYFWRLYQAGGTLAARPGTSNHGLGIAVDVPTPAMRATIDRIGAAYGWSKTWSDAPTEWWHIRFDPSRVTADLSPPRSGFTVSELRWMGEYDRLMRAGRDAGRRRVLRRVMSAQRKRVWRAAQGPGGWARANRANRYRSLKARTT